MGRLFFLLVLMLTVVKLNAKNHALNFTKIDSASLIQPEICVISANTVNYGLTIYWTSLDTNAIKFIIYKKLEFQTNYDSIGVVPINNTGFYYFVSNNPSYKDSYKIISVDSTGRKSLPSDYYSCLSLNALEIEDDKVVKLSWNNIPSNANDSVIIWRNNNAFGYNFVKKVAINDTSYLDTNYLAWHIQYILEFTSQDTCFLIDSGQVTPRLYSNSSSVFFGSSNQNKPITIKVYPNPVSDVLMFNTEENFERALISIYNTVGQKISETVIINNNADVSNVVPGAYTFTLMLNGIIYRGKFVK